MSDPDEPTGDGAEPIGSAAEEAAKLIDALSTWARDRGPDLGASLGAGLTAGLAGLAGHAANVAHAAKDLGAELDDHLATGAPECTYCPICRAVHAVREASPEIKAHLADAAGSLMQAAASVLAAAATPSSGDGERGDAVEHIDLDHDAGQLWPEEDET